MGLSVHDTAHNSPTNLNIFTFVVVLSFKRKVLIKTV